MRVINIHKRTLDQSFEKVSELFMTLATYHDLVWPYENWPAIRFNDGLKVGSKGGHGPIHYIILDFKEGEYIKFGFSKPEGFNGTHELKIIETLKGDTEIIHEIRMATSLKATFLWVFMIRWLHDALIEDVFDKVENYFAHNKKETKYGFWVKLLREAYKRKPVQTKHA